jgi:hypothetical protein
MRILFFVLTVFSSMTSLAASQFSGVLVKDHNSYFLTSVTGCKRFAVSSTDNDVNQNLKKMDAGDLITATGTLDTDKCTADVNSIDYVGLKKMLGVWYSDEGLFTVTDYSNLSYYPLSSKDLPPSNNTTDFQKLQPINYQYSMTPSDGAEWVIFLTDKTQTSLATIKVSAFAATMKIFDSQNGNVLKTLYLQKWSQSK